MRLNHRRVMLEAFDRRKEIKEIPCIEITWVLGSHLIGELVSTVTGYIRCRDHYNKLRRLHESGYKETEYRARGRNDY